MHRHSFNRFTETKAVIQLVMPASWLERINEIAYREHRNRSEVIRMAIAAVYFPEDEPDAKAQKMGD